MDYQKMIIVGNATKDAEVHQSEAKTAYADFTVAVSTAKDETTSSRSGPLANSPRAVRTSRRV